MDSGFVFFFFNLEAYRYKDNKALKCDQEKTTRSKFQ